MIRDFAQNMRNTSVVVPTSAMLYVHIVRSYTASGVFARLRRGES